LLPWLQGGAHVRPKPCPEGDKGEAQVVPVTLSLIHDISSVRIYMPDNLIPRDKRLSVLKSIKEVRRRFPDGNVLLCYLLPAWHSQSWAN